MRRHWKVEGERGRGELGVTLNPCAQIRPKPGGIGRRASSKVDIRRLN